MKRDPLSSSYARALLDLAVERGQEDEVLEETQSFLALLGDDPAFGTFVETPSIDAKDKNRVLDKVFRSKVTDTFLDTIQLVIHKGRQLFTRDILEEYGTLYDEKAGRVHAEVVSAVALSEDEQSTVTSALSEKLDKTIILENKVDPGILGGLVLRFGDLVVDGSARTQLRKVAVRMKAMKLGSEYVHEN